ncbi:MAG: class I SAM-dependent methyltransferase [Planctomycetota bacterium]
MNNPFKPEPTPENMKELKEYYNSRFLERPIREKDRFYSWIIKISRVNQNASVLDVGCGLGLLLRETENLSQNLFGVDISEVAIKKAVANGINAQFVVAEGENLPFPSGYFDFVFNLGSLEHFLKPETSLSEMARILKTDGTCVIMLPNSFYSGHIWRVVRTGLGPTHHQALERFATLNEWRILIESNGFVVEKVKKYNKFKLWKTLLPFNLAYAFIYFCRKK